MIRWVVQELAEQEVRVLLRLLRGSLVSEGGGLVPDTFVYLGGWREVWIGRMPVRRTLCFSGCLWSEWKDRRSAAVGLGHGEQRIGPCLLVSFRPSVTFDYAGSPHH